MKPEAKEYEEFYGLTRVRGTVTRLKPVPLLPPGPSKIGGARRRKNVAATLAATAIFTCRNLGTWLVVSGPLPQNADLLFCFAGEPERVEHTIGLALKCRTGTGLR